MEFGFTNIILAFLNWLFFERVLCWRALFDSPFLGPPILIAYWIKLYIDITKTKVSTDKQDRRKCHQNCNMNYRRLLVPEKLGTKSYKFESVTKAFSWVLGNFADFCNILEKHCWDRSKFVFKFKSWAYFQS